jgi:hypothetical protein
MCFGYTKTHLLAYVTFKIFPGVIPRTPVKREGKGRERGEGREGKGRGGKKGMNWIAYTVIFC